MRNTDEYTKARVRSHPMQCWNCKRFAPKLIEELNSEKPNEKYIGNLQVVGKPVATEFNGKMYWRYKVWTGEYKMNFGHFCMQKCATSWANKQVWNIKKKGKKGDPVDGNHKFEQLKEMRDKLSNHFNRH